MRYFVRQAAYGARVCAFNQYCKSISCDDILQLISEELNVKGIIYDFIESYMKNENKHLKMIEKDYEKSFTDYKGENIEEKEKYIIEKLTEPPVHRLIKQLKLIELLWEYDCVSLYPSAM